MSDILTRLRGYNPPDRTEWTGRLISQDLHDAADEIERLRARIAELEAQLQNAGTGAMAAVYVRGQDGKTS